MDGFGRHSKPRRAFEAAVIWFAKRSTTGIPRQQSGNQSESCTAAEKVEAIPVWEALVERYPDDCWGNVNLQELFFLTGRSRR